MQYVIVEFPGHTHLFCYKTPDMALYIIICIWFH